MIMIAILAALLGLMTFGILYKLPIKLRFLCASVIFIAVFVAIYVFLLSIGDS